jgi:hypothetical protein
MDMKRIQANGLLFIGDPHQDSKTPGRRTDEKFAKTVADKITQAMVIAQEQGLVPVFTGDFFNRDDDMDAEMLVLTIQALRTKGHIPWSLIGNHEKRRTVLTPDTAMSVLIEAGLIQKMPQNGMAFELESPRIGGGCHVVGVGGTCYDENVPSDVMPFKHESMESVVWVTHHDWLFEDGYPNAQKPFEINGCEMVVNGHLHLTKRPKRVGQTTYYNPGNITRMSIDAYAHVPRVWVYRPGHPGLHPIALKYVKECFDFVGKSVSAATDSLVKDTGNSAFVALMAQEMENMEQKTQDGSLFLSRMQQFCESHEVPHVVQEHLAELFKDVRYQSSPN